MMIVTSWLTLNVFILFHFLQKRLVNPSGANSYGQPPYPPPAHWGQQVQPPMQQQQPQYDYAHSGSYHTPPMPSTYYSSYPTQVAGWDQNQSTISQPPQQSTGYGYYGQQAQLASTPQNPDYNYDQTLPSHSYDQSYSQQSSNYGQHISSQAYGPPPVQSNPNGTTFSQTTQQSPAHPPTYSQPMANPQAGYWAYPSSTNQPPASTYYDQTGYYQTGYGGEQQGQVPPPAVQPGYPGGSQPGYGEGGYPYQSAPEHAAPSYVQATHHPDHGESRLEQQPEEQANGVGHSSVPGDQSTDDGNPAAGSAPVEQETNTSQS